MAFTQSATLQNDVIKPQNKAGASLLLEYFDRQLSPEFVATSHGCDSACISSCGIWYPQFTMCSMYDNCGSKLFCVVLTVSVDISKACSGQVLETVVLILFDEILMFQDTLQSCGQC